MTKIHSSESLKTVPEDISLSNVSMGYVAYKIFVLENKINERLNTVEHNSKELFTNKIGEKCHRNNRK
jgi:hypothetical protein